MTTSLDEPKVLVAVTEKIEEGKMAAERLIRRARQAVEEGAEEAVYAVKRHPATSVAIAFAAGPRWVSQRHASAGGNIRGTARTSRDACVITPGGVRAK